MKKVWGVLLVFVAFSLQIKAQSIEEILSNPPGTDSTWEYIELKFSPSTAVGNKALLYVDGDKNGTGVLKRKFDLNGITSGSNGLVLLTAGVNPYTGVPAATTVANVFGVGSALENGSGTFMLVSYANASDLPNNSTDLDVNDDGTLEILPGTVAVLDCVGFIEKGASGDGDIVYCTTKNDTSLLGGPDGYYLTSNGINGFGKPKGSNGVWAFDTINNDPASLSGLALSPGVPNGTVSGIIKNEVNKYGINIYPNPNAGTGTITITGQKPSFGSIDIYNLAGAKVYNVYEGQLNAGKNEFAFSLDLESGLYLIGVRNNEGITFSKCIVE